MELSNIRNFRHLPGTNLYRCAQPETGSDADLEKLLNEAGIRTIVDMRRKFEIDSAKLESLGRFYRPVDSDTPGAGGDFPADDRVGKLYHVDMVSARKFIKVVSARLPWYIKLLFGVMTLVSRLSGMTWIKVSATRIGVSYAMDPYGILRQYTDMVDLCGQNIVKVLRLLTEEGSPSTPCLVCCSFGKDRTGFTVALVLDILGFPREDIVQDYAQTAESLRGVKEEILEGMRGMGLPNPEFAGAEKETMVQLLGHIDSKYGSVSAYLSSIGFDTADQAKLRLSMTA